MNKDYKLMLGDELYQKLNSIAMLPTLSIYISKCFTSLMNGTKVNDESITGTLLKCCLILNRNNKYKTLEYLNEFQMNKTSEIEKINMDFTGDIMSKEELLKDLAKSKRLNKTKSKKIKNKQKKGSKSKMLP